MSKVFTIAGILLLAFLALPKLEAQSNARRPFVQHATVAANVNTETTCISAPTGYRILLLKVKGRADTAGVLTFKDGVAGSAFFKYYLPANSNENFDLFALGNADYEDGWVTNEAALTVQAASTTVTLNFDYAVIR